MSLMIILSFKTQTIFNKCFPMRKIKYNGGTIGEKSWLTNSILNSCKRKNKLYKISLTLKTAEAVAKYKAYKNKLNHLLRISERKYYYDKFESIKENLGST